MASDPNTQPVIVGVGETTDRPADPALGLEPAALAVAALRRAEEDAGASLLARLDSLDVVGVVSWSYDDLPGLIAERIGATPFRRHHGPIGGQTPVQFLHEAAQRIARGESAVAAVCGAESSHTATTARRRGVTLPWTKPSLGADASAEGWLPTRNRSYLHALARQHGVTEPVTVYPLYETATAAAWHQTPAEADAEAAALWAGLSATAAGQAGAWLRTAMTAETIATVSAANRMIAYPYPKLMVANPAVNQGAAVLLTSLAVARAAGVPEDRLVHVGEGAAAAETLDWCSRDRFDHAPGQEAVLDAMLEAAERTGSQFDVLELYSCFPVVPKMARRRLRLPTDTPVSAAGGLTFHGAPLNNYMTHGAVACVRALRQRDGLGLLYGQGGTLTWHHGLTLGHAPTPRDCMLRPASRQDTADQRRGAAPQVVFADGGVGTLETFTITYDRNGDAGPGTAVLRLPDGARTLARVDPADRETLSMLQTKTRSPVGVTGRLRPGPDDLALWSST